MSENTENNRNVRNDEIDLLDLFNRMGRAIARGFKALWTAFLISVVFLVRRWLPLTLIIALAFGLSYTSMKSTSSLYTTDMVIRNNALNNSLLISHINRLNNLNVEAMSRTLGISPETSKNIAGINAFWIIDNNKDETMDFVDYSNSHDIYDTTNIRMPDRVDIRLNIKELQNLTEVRKGIFRYIENDSTFKQQNRLRIKQRTELLNRIEYDIADLDSVQKVKYFEEPRGRIAKTNGQIVFMQEQQLPLLYKDIQNLMLKKQELEEELSLYPGIVSLINDFSIPTTRTNSLPFYLKKYLPVLFITMLILLIIIANREKIREVYNKY